MSYYTSGRYQVTNARIQQRNLANIAASRSRAVNVGGGSGGGGLTAAAEASFGKAIDQYKPGGAFTTGIEAGLERGRVKSTAGGMQNLVSAGLSNTTTAGGLNKKYEEEVGAPTRASAEMQRAQGMAGLYASMAGAQQGAYEGGANRRLSLSQTMMQQFPEIEIPSYQNTPNPYMSGIPNTYSRTASKVSDKAPSLY